MDHGATTVKSHFNGLVERYTGEILSGQAATTNTSLSGLVRQLLGEFEAFWGHMLAVGAISINDEVDDYSTTSLEMMWTPYVIGDLYQRVQGSVNYGETTQSNVQCTTGEAKEGSAGRVPLSSATRPLLPASDFASLTRQEALARSHEWFKIFFEWMEHMSLVDEKTVETYAVYHHDKRTQRIELAHRRNELESQVRECENKVRYMHAKRKRMQELIEEGEVVEEAGGEEEEALRDRAIARLKWSIYDACHQLQLSSRELEMLKTFDPSQRACISTAYQERLDAVKRGELSLGRQTYTLLPGGMMMVGTPQNPQPVSAAKVANSGGVSSQALSAMANQQQFRQQVKAELMVDRNLPTLTLQEFAEMEMAEVQRQMDVAAETQQRQAEEDERLGPEGVEERQRQKDSKWADWKDDHPANGVTSKGNYS